jgi:pyruvate dehydrogenase E2 component (dihydrolipoamide acetyltransferase)
MITSLTFPALSPTMSEGTLVSWRVKPGDVIKAGQVVAEIQTDKAVAEWESPDAGTVRELLVAANQSVVVNTVAAILTTKGEDVAEAVAKAKAANAQLNAAKTEPTPAPAAAPAPAPAPAPFMAPGPRPAQAAARKVRVSPVAARLAAEHGLDLGRITGTGPDGRIVRKDVERALADGSAKPQAAAAAAVPNKPKLKVHRADAADREVAFTPMRQVIAQRLTASKQQIPHFYVQDAIDASAITALREQLGRLDGVKVTVNDLVLRACALALRAHPRVNATLNGSTVRQHDRVDLSVAVALPEGLITPIVKDAHAKSVRQIGDEVRALAKRAQEGRLKPEEFQGGTFTVSNLGATGIQAFSAIINPPQVAILAVAAIRDEPVVRGGALAAGQVMRLTLSADHRAVDGADAAAFMATLRQLLEAPASLLI